MSVFVGECDLGAVAIVVDGGAVVAVSIGDDVGVCAAVTEDVIAARAFAVVAGAADDVDVVIAPAGTAFQRRVWDALRAIHAGSTTTYAAFTTSLELPSTSVRAVAQAIAKNPIAVIVPCHRVLGADGALTGFRWGIERKEALLHREGVIATRSTQLGLF